MINIEKYEKELVGIINKHALDKESFVELGNVIKINDGVIRGYKYFIKELKTAQIEELKKEEAEDGGQDTDS